MPSCANKELLTNYLRNELGFYGYITSDCGAVDCYVESLDSILLLSLHSSPTGVQNTHHYTDTPAQTIDAVFGAGMDSDCGGYTQDNIVNSVETGSADLQDIQAATYRSTLVQMRLGLFDPQSTQPWAHLGVNDVNTPKHQQISHEAARQGMVLLKNVAAILPLASKNLKIALIGPNADNTDVMKGNYFGNPPVLYSVRQGLEEYVSKADIAYVKGCDINSGATKDFAQAVKAAEAADVTLLVMGLDQSQESEGNDRESIALPGQQNNLIANITASAQVENVILVLVNGGCVDVARWRDSAQVGAIIAAGYPGMFGGLAIADVVFGAFNPTGLLDQTWYLSSYTAEVQMLNMDMRPNATVGPYGASPGRGYRYYNGTVVFQFGAGLSFTTFSCGNMTVQADEISLHASDWM